MMSVGKAWSNVDVNYVFKQHFVTPHSALAPHLQSTIKFQYSSIGINLVFFIIVLNVTNVT